jgi:hypothetical protein
MTIAYKWKIVQCHRLTANGFITTAHWEVLAIDGNYSAYIYGTCGFADATLSVLYANVTEEMVLNWCWANGVDKDAIEANLATQIEMQKTPITATGLPW